MDERHLEPEHAAARLGVDQLRSARGELRHRRAHVVDLVCDVVHAGAALRQEATYRRVRAERLEELDALLTDVEPDSRSSETVGTVKVVSLPGD